MDWMICPSCGQRFLPTELGCPNCPGTARRAISELHSLEVAQAAAPPKRDPSLCFLHGAFAASLLSVVVAWRAPPWVLAVAAFELAIAVSAQARWRLVRTLVHARAVIYLGCAAVLFNFQVGSPLDLLVFLVHGPAVWAFARSGESLLSESARGVDRSEAGTRSRGLTLIPIAMTWVFLLGGIRGLGR